MFRFKHILPSWEGCGDYSWCQRLWCGSIFDRPWPPSAFWDLTVGRTPSFVSRQVLMPRGCNWDSQNSGVKRWSQGWAGCDRRVIDRLQRLLKLLYQHYQGVRKVLKLDASSHHEKPSELTLRDILTEKIAGEPWVRVADLPSRSAWTCFRFASTCHWVGRSQKTKAGQIGVNWPLWMVERARPNCIQL